MSDSCVLAVMYHYVRDRAGTPYGTVRGLSTSAFGEQLDSLCRQMEPVSWPQFVTWKKGRAHLPPRGFLLTFDDGLSDHAEVVAPMLEQRGLTGVFFVSGSALAGSRIEPAHQIHILQAILGDRRFDQAVETWLAANDSHKAWLAEVDLTAAMRVYHYETPARAATKYLLSFSLPIPIRNQMLDALIAEYVGNPQQLASEWYMKPDDLIRLQADGHAVGGHGFSHEPMQRLSPAQRHRELGQSHDALRRLLGDGPRPFSFPYGSFDRQIVDECRAAGFSHAFTTRVGWINPQDDDGCLNRVDTIRIEAFVGEEMACPRLS